MSLAVDPLRFLGQLLLSFVALFFVWLFVGPWYTSFLAVLAELAVSIADRPTAVWSAGTALFFWPRGLALPPQPPTIAGEWIQANTILLLALMIATPAATWEKKGKRLALAFALVLLWQVTELVLAIQFGYATQVDPQAYSARARYRLALLTNLAMYVDTQVVPFMIWAGIHFRELLARALRRPSSQGEAQTVRAKKHRSGRHST
ncbi:MAG: hypothetical protein KatS3mg077_2839 [Candidatus Binatia bacterium]|nr:MAG: hypothetical protein KatS3mg077_2839 [Candidatus Binatia bacterium]